MYRIEQTGFGRAPKGTKSGITKWSTEKCLKFHAFQKSDKTVPLLVSSVLVVFRALATHEIRRRSFRNQFFHIPQKQF